MYNGFELAHNAEIKNTYVGTIDVSDFDIVIGEQGE